MNFPRAGESMTPPQHHGEAYKPPLNPQRPLATPPHMVPRALPPQVQQVPSFPAGAAYAGYPPQIIPPTTSPYYQYPTRQQLLQLNARQQQQYQQMSTNMNPPLPRNAGESEVSAQSQQQKKRKREEQDQPPPHRPQPPPPALPNSLSHQQPSTFHRDSFIYSPCFCCFTTLRFYAQLCNELSQIAESLDLPRNNKGRANVWNYFYWITGEKKTISQDALIKPMIDQWLAAESIDISMIEYLYLAILCVPEEHFQDS